MVNGHEFNDSAQCYWSNLSAIPKRYLYEGMTGIRRGMWSVSWFKEILGEPWENLAKKEKTCVEQLLENEAVHIPAGSDGLITVPEFLCPNDIPYRKAMMIGFDGRHKRSHMYRSILEAIAMTMHMSMEDMFEERDISGTVDYFWRRVKIQIVYADFCGCIWNAGRSK